MEELLVGPIIGGVIALLGVIYGHWVKRRGDKENNKVQLVAELNDQEIEKKKLDFEVLKTTVESLRTEVKRLSEQVKDFDEKLQLVTGKYWRLVHVVRAWVSRYHIDADEIPEDIRKDI